MKKLRIVFRENAPYDEVVDSVADALEAGIIVEESLQDGFQVQDLLNALQVQPKIQEIVNDVPVFIAQFTKLNPDTAKAVVLEAKARLMTGGKKLGVVTTFIIRLLFVASDSYGYAVNTYQGAQNQFMLWQTFLGGGRVFPEDAIIGEEEIS